MAQKKAETGVEIVAFSQQIMHSLYDGGACVKSIGAGTAITLGGLVKGNVIYRNFAHYDLVPTSMFNVFHNLKETRLL